MTTMKEMNQSLQPFFTAKPTGQARSNGSSGRRTGLGLSLSYDIITKGHGGVPIAIGMKVETKERR
jgi:signal transduction histidine kinase